HSTSTPDDSVDLAASRPQPTSGDSGDSGDSGEPSGEGAVGEPAPPTHDAIYEPPLPEPHFGREPVVLPPPPHIAPRASVWVGARTGWLFPFGSMWQDGTAPSGLCCVYQRRSFDDFASSG